MAHLGFVLVIVGTVLGSVGGARLPRADILSSVLGIAILALGALLLVLRRRQAASDSNRPGGGMTDNVFALMRELKTELAALHKAADTAPLADIVSRLTQLETEKLRPIADAVPALVGVMNGARFTAVFGPYASSERLMMRAWSAAADHHRNEVVRALTQSLDRLNTAVAACDDRSLKE